VPDAVTGLVALLDMSPTDAEAWSELADVYLSQGLYPQAIYALEEVLVLIPNAWNVSVTLHPRFAQSPFCPGTGAMGKRRQAKNAT
jgi:tetratricopeptide (TPR) repeat protein